MAAAPFSRTQKNTLVKSKKDKSKSSIKMQYEQEKSKSNTSKNPQFLSDLWSSGHS